MQLPSFVSAFFPGGTPRVLRYLVAGGTAAATNLSILYVLTEFFHLWYLFSSIIAVSVAWVVSFTLQKFWTFENRSLERVHIQAPLHLSLSLTNILVNTAFLFVLVEYFGIWYIGAQVIAGGFLACVNYFIYKHYIFIE